jgi:hypothetical protein
LSLFGILSSDIHGLWAWENKTSLGGDLYSLVYAHGNVFETFPFPDGFLDDGNAALEEAGREFFDIRQAYMEDNNKGLTKFYNEFHDPNEQRPGLANVRLQQSELNRIVFGLYDWCDLNPECDFHEVDYLPVERNIRFTVDGRVQSEVRRRLSALNKERHLAGDSTAAEVSRSNNIDATEPDENDLFHRGNRGPADRQGA